MRQSTNYPVGSGTNSCHSVTKHVSFSCWCLTVLFVFGLLFFEEKVGIEVGRVDIVDTVDAISELFFEKKIIDSNAVIMSVVLDISSGFIDIFTVLA